MAKSETITTRAPGSGKKTPVKKAPHSAKPKSKGTARKATSSKAGAARKATKSKKGSSKTKPRGKTEAEEPYPTWAAPTPAAAVEAVARLAAVHGLPSPPERKSILDSLVRTILSQNTTDKTSAVAFARLKEGLPTWSQVLAAPEGVAEDLVRCGGLAEVKMERVRAILRDDRVRTDSEPSLEWLHSKPDEEVKAALNSFKGVGPKTVACVMMFTMGRAEFPVDTHVLHIAKKLDWLPADASREQAYEHLNRRVPNECKLDLHILLVEHGKCCAKCAKNGKLQKKECAVEACPLVDLS